MDKILGKESSFFRKLFSETIATLTKKKEPDLSEERKQLLADIEKALDDLRYARDCFSAARDPEIIEACIFEIKSAEARYSFLLRKAKRLSEKEKKISA